jgi:hypothetical protein
MGLSSELGPIDPQVPIDLRVIFPSPDPDLFGDDPFSFVPSRVIRDFLEWAGVIVNGRGERESSVDLQRLGQVVEKTLNPWVLGWYERSDKVSRLYATDGLVGHLLNGPARGGEDCRSHR